MRRRSQIFAGEPQLHCWCPVCQMPTRVRVPLHIGSLGTEPAAELEICPGCGTGHDRPSVSVTSSDGPRGWHPLTTFTHALHAWACRRRGLAAIGCAHRDCRWPGLYRHQHQMTGEDGTWRFLFCTRRHKRAWLAENHFHL